MTVLGAQNTGQVLRGFKRVIGYCEEMGIENPMIEPVVMLTKALGACVVQGFQTVGNMVKDVSVKDLDEFMYEVAKEILELTG